MRWREQTHGTKVELLRHFLVRMFDSEMFSTRGQGMTVAVSALALAIPAGMLLLDPPYAHRAIGSSPAVLRAVAIADQLAMLTLIGAITGVLALLAWQSLFPSRRDLLALAGLPVRPRQIFEARFAAVAAGGRRTGPGDESAAQRHDTSPVHRGAGGELAAHDHGFRARGIL